MRPDLLLLDGETRAALSVCRSLGKRGLKILVAGGAGAITHGSRYASERLSAPERYDFDGWLIETIRERHPKMLLPVTDNSLEKVLAFGGLPEGTELPIVNRETLEKVQKKDLLLEIAGESGIRCPKSLLITRGSDYTWNTFPAVIKGARAGLISGEKRATIYVNDLPELQMALRTFREGEELLLQERIDGQGVGFFALADKGELLATFAHRRLLEKPPTGGVSVLSESISIDDAPLTPSASLLKRLNWSGVAMVEFKQCFRTGEFILMEINPRFWGSTELAVSAGVDFPWLLWLWSQGELDSTIGRREFAAAKNYRTGLRLRWDLGTLDHLLIRLKNEKLDSLKGILLQNQLQFFASKPIVHETFRWNDPVPFIYELWNYLF